MQYITNSENETKKLAEGLAKKLSGLIALSGELGAGKTVFVQGFAKGLGIKEKIISPTFVLIRQHKLPNQKLLYHIDLYRLEGKIDIKRLGIEELFASDNLVLIEWADKIEKSLPKKTIKINLKKVTTNERLITVS